MSERQSVFPTESAQSQLELEPNSQLDSFFGDQTIDIQIKTIPQFKSSFRIGSNQKTPSIQSLH
jgi:hypothetical protein